jgi:hypothetical protein
MSSEPSIDPPTTTPLTLPFQPSLIDAPSFRVAQTRVCKSWPWLTSIRIEDIGGVDNPTLLTISDRYYVIRIPSDRPTIPITVALRLFLHGVRSYWGKSVCPHLERWSDIRHHYANLEYQHMFLPRVAHLHGTFSNGCAATFDIKMSGPSLHITLSPIELSKSTSTTTNSTSMLSQTSATETKADIPSTVPSHYVHAYVPIMKPRLIRCPVAPADKDSLYTSSPDKLAAMLVRPPIRSFAAHLLANNDVALKWFNQQWIRFFPSIVIHCNRHELYFQHVEHSPQTTPALHPTTPVILSGLNLTLAIPDGLLPFPLQSSSLQHMLTLLLQLTYFRFFDYDEASIGHQPLLLLIDDPFVHLNPARADSLNNLLRSICNDPNYHCQIIVVANET